MLEPDVTLTDYVLTIQCAVFAILLFSRVKEGAGGRLTASFGALFVALSGASALGGTYHGFFSLERSASGDALWLGTLLAIGIANFFIWLSAAEIGLSVVGKRMVLWVAALQLTAFVSYVVFISRDFLIASASTAPAMLFMLWRFSRALFCRAGGTIWLGWIGLITAFAGALIQQLRIGIHPDYFNHNALYHVVQVAAFALIFMSVAGLEKSKTELLPRSGSGGTAK